MGSEGSFPERTKERSYEKAAAHLGRKLLRWYESVLPGLSGDSAEVLTEFCIMGASLSVLREKKLITDHEFVSFCCFDGKARSCQMLLERLPPPVRELDLFRRLVPGSLPVIDPEQGKILAGIFSGEAGPLLCQDPSGEWVGRILEILLSGKHNRNAGLSVRKRTGSFYTPRPVVSYMVKEALIRYFRTEAQIRSWQAEESSFRHWVTSVPDGRPLPPDLERYRSELLCLLRECRILDPSCGSGFFLLEAFRLCMLLWESLEKTDPLSPDQIRSSRGAYLLKNVLYGMDIQFIPLQIAQFCCYLEYSSSCLDPLPEQNLYCCNAVLDPPGDMENFFDIVVGNPPYVAIPSIPPAERALYRANCSFAKGRFNLFYLFLEKSRFWMKQNACSIFLVPDRVLLNTQCGFLRDFLLKRMELFQWVSFETHLFRSASVDPVILGYRKSCPPGRGGHLIQCRKISSVEKLKCSTPLMLSPEELCNASRSGTEEKSFALREKIRKKSSLVLGDIVTIRDGIIQGPIEKDLFLKGPLQRIALPPEECGKLLFGRNISPYRIQFRENYVHYNIPLMKELERKVSSKKSSSLRMRRKEIFLVPKILSRQTADRIIAALDEKGEYFYANTLHGSTLIPSCGYDLYCILGIMNSRLATFLYRGQSMEQGKAFAQIKIALLKDLPIPDMKKKEQIQISSLVRKILALPENGEKYAFAQLRRRIDAMIYAFYDLTPEEIALVESHTPSGT